MTQATNKSRANSIWLYHFPGTRAARVRWLLEELKVPYVLAHVDLRQTAHKQPEYLKIHPLGKVPALQINGLVLFESLAICLYLADIYAPGTMAPAPANAQQDPDLRAAYYTWMAFSNGTLEPAIFEQSRFKKAAELNTIPIDMGPAFTPFENAAQYLEQTLSDQPFLLGEHFTAADIMNGSLMMMADSLNLLKDYPHILAWITGLKSRPAYQLANGD